MQVGGDRAAALPKASSTIWAAGSAGNMAGKHRLGCCGAEPAPRTAPPRWLIKPSLKKWAPHLQRRHAQKTWPHSRQYQNPPSLASTSAGSSGIAAGCGQCRGRIALNLAGKPCIPKARSPRVRSCSDTRGTQQHRPFATALEVCGVAKCPSPPVAKQLNSLLLLSAHQRALPAADGLHGWARVMAGRR